MTSLSVSKLALMHLMVRGCRTAKANRLLLHITLNRTRSGHLFKSLFLECPMNNMLSDSRALTRPASRKRGLLAFLLVMGLLCAPTWVAAQNQLPALGDPTSDDFSLAAEKQLGAAVMREIRVDPDYLDDPVLLEYLQQLWRPLVAQAKARGTINADVDERLAWEAFLVRDPSVNAFALPGGYVGVHLGLMALTDSRDQLASVLAHELSHISQRHIARSISNNKRQSMLALATTLVGVLVASRSTGSTAAAANATIAGGQALAAQGQLNFSRDMEREADRLGFGLLAGAGYDKTGMASMFEKLDSASRLNDNHSFPYLRSHPLTTERIGEARARVGLVATEKSSPNAMEHSLAQARARVLMDPRAGALRRWQALDTALKSIAGPPQDNLTPSGGLMRSSRLGGAVTPKPLAHSYTSALASTLLRDWPRADAALATAVGLLRDAPDSRAERWVQLLQAQSLLARGQAARAMTALEPYAQERSRPVLLLSAQAALAVNDAAQITRLGAELQTWCSLHPLDSLAWSSLSQLEERAGHALRALRADAESRVALGDLAGALDRLRAGQKRARGPVTDFMDASVIDARLRDVTKQYRTQQADEKTLN
jgi:beta-barrel assembly-enhancing protease